MKVKELFREIQRLHPQWLSFTYWPERSEIMINEYARGYTLINTYRGTELCVDEATRYLIQILLDTLNDTSNEGG